MMSRGRRVGLLVNPSAKSNRTSPSMTKRLATMMQGRGLYAESPSLNSIEGIAQDFKQQGIDILAIGGGDGTASYALTKFREVYDSSELPAIALLRAGTMNTVANGIGVRRGHPEQMLRRLLEAAESGKGLRSKTMATLDMNGQVGFITGTGVIPAFLKEYYDAGDSYPTPMTAFKLLSRAAAGALVGSSLSKKIADPIPFEVSVDGQSWPTTAYLTIGAATVPQIGLGFTPFYRSGEDSERFHVVGFTCSKVGFVRALWPIFQGKPTNPAYTHESLASQAVIRQLNGPTLYTVDGEVLSAEELVIGRGPTVDVVWG